jgi:hypothetical protein
MLGEEAELSFDDVDLDDDDDDLYGADESSTKQQTRASASGPSNPADFIFRVHDRLPNYAPIGDITIGSTRASLPTSRDDASSDPMAERELVYPAGRKAAGGLAILRREIDPAVQLRKKLPRAKAIWGVRPIVGLAAGAEFDEYLVASLSTEEGSAESALYKITATGLEPTQKDDFDPEAGATIEVGTVAGSSRIVQVLSDEVKCYDAGKQLYTPFLTLYFIAYQVTSGIVQMTSTPQAISIVSAGHGSNACFHGSWMGILCISVTCVSFWLVQLHWLRQYVTSLAASRQIAQYYSICPLQLPNLLARVF